MKKNDSVLNILLAVVMGVALIGWQIWKTVRPWAVFPEINIPVMAGIVILSLLLEYRIVGMASHKWVLQTCLAAVTFGALLYVSGVVEIVEVLKYSIVGGTVFFSAGIAFDSMVHRVEVTCSNRAAVVPLGFVLFLAYQCFAGIIL